MLCALPPVDQSSTQLGWGAGWFVPASDARDRRRVRHPGLDFMADAGAPVVAPYAGVVIQKGFKPYGSPLPGSAVQDGFGNYVAIEHSLPGHRRPQQVTVYAHLQGESPLRVGQRVAAGDLVGRVGTSGRRTGAGDRAFLFFKVMLPREPSFGESEPDYGHASLPALDPLDDFFRPLGVVHRGGQTPGPPVSPFAQAPPWGGNLVLEEVCTSLSSISTSAVRGQYARFGSTQLASRAIYSPALYAEGESGPSAGSLALGFALVAGGVWLITRKSPEKAPPWWVRQQRWKRS